MVQSSAEVIMEALSRDPERTLGGRRKKSWDLGMLRLKTATDRQRLSIWDVWILLYVTNRPNTVTPRAEPHFQHYD